MDRVTLEQREAELKTEFATGQRQLAECEARATSVREQLLRISGALRLLEELLAEQKEAPRSVVEPSHAA